ncbi:hypothetical protein ACSQ6I_19260 [Anabaena sp. WFMT]|uniref:hypothetical protein n=1 Tax=Anabaena sp. WFMT TaxID=3449730 RepID=UPI003F205F2C
MPKRKTKLNIYEKWIALSVILVITFFFTSSILNAQEIISPINQNPLCQQVDFQEIAKKGRPTLNSILIETTSPIIPDGETIDIKISKPTKEGTVFCARIDEKDIEVLTAKNSSEGKTILTIKTPKIGWKNFNIEKSFELISIPFDEATGKYQVASPNFYILQDVKISSWPLSFIGSIALLIVIYLVAAIPVYNLKTSIDKSIYNSQNIDHVKFAKKHSPQRIREFFLQIIKYLDLVTFTTEKSGKASISNLQITWFTLIVFGLLIHVLLRTGQLSAISEDILWLLGISGTAKILSMGIDVSANRLSLDNLAWLRIQGYLNDSNQSKNANWKDLINTNGSFDVYKYQLLLFSFIVGITLTISGLRVLTEFKLPEGFLNLLGLSNVVYIFGNTISPNSIAELNKYINELRGFEKEYSSDPSKYIMKARDVAGMLTLIYGKESTKFNPEITDSLLEPKLLK